MKFKLVKLLLRGYWPTLECKPLVVFLFSILLTPGPLFSQEAQQNEYKTIHVKFKEHLKPANAVNGRTANSGVEKVDKVGEKYKAIRIKRIFPDAGVFEKAHQAYGLHLWYEIKIAKDAKLKDALEDYRGTNYFDNVEESRPYSSVHSEDPVAVDLPTLPSGSNDPLFTNQWHFENTGQSGGTPGADINLIKAWQSQSGSPNVIVAIIDGGIRLNHPDIQDALWVNDDEIPGNRIDDDHNGYVDDIHGYGFGDQSPTIYPDAHATHVSGTIGAVSNNGIGVSGIAGGNGVESGVRLMSCAGFGNFHIGGFEEAMVYAADNGAVISQNSWGGGSNAIEDAIDYFISRAGYDNSTANFSKNIQTGPMAGGVVIFAAGNSNTSSTYYGYPASYEKVIAVASTDNTDVKSHFSNYGTWVDISAPGSGVYSTYGASYGYLSGTSMACPHVSGVAALIISHLQRAGLKPSEVWNRLRFSARSINSMNPNFKGQLGWGRLDAFVALKEPDAIPPGPIADIHVEEIHSTSLLLKWTASGENNTEGQAAEYEIRYSTSVIDESNFKDATLIANAPVPPISGDQVSFEVKNLSPVTTYYFALKSIDVFNNISPLSNVVSIRTLRLPTPELVTDHLSEQLFTGVVSTREVLIKNVGDEDELLVRTGTPQLQPASVLPPLGTKGRLFAINTSRNTIEELNAKTGKLIHSTPLPEPSSKTSEGLAFDGTHIYYGRSRNIYKINIETGDVIRTINLNGASAINGLAWSGKYLYVSWSSGGNYKTYEVDVDNGSVLRTLDLYSELAFLGSNNTLLRTSGGQVEEIDIANGDFIRTIPNVRARHIAFSIIDSLLFVSDELNSIIKAVRPTDGAVMYTIPYPITTALAGDEHQLGWFEIKEQVIKIPAGQTAGVPVTFNSSGLNSGTWTGSVKIIPINSNTDPLPVQVTLNVQSGTDIETAKELNFGTEYLGFPIDTTIIVENRGFTNLVIEQIQSNDSRVASSISSATLVPGQKIELQIRVEPDGPGSIDAHITFTSNDPDEGTLIIPVSANILEAPAITVTPDSLKATLSSGESTTLNITLTNTGSSPLHWSANLVGTDSTIVTQSQLMQNGVPSQSDTAVNKNDLGDVTLKASSPEPLTCLAYDPEGELIYAKGISSTNFYTYNLAIDAWTKIGITPLSEFYGQATYLNGKLYHGGSQLNIYTIQSDSWTSVPFPVAGTAVSITSDNKHVYIAIGKILYRFDPVTETWAELPPASTSVFFIGFSALSHHGGVIFANGKLAVTGSGNTPFLKYFIDSNTWVSSKSISGKVSSGGAIDISSARYFVLGAPESSPSQRIQMSILDIRNAEWSWLVTPFDVGSFSGLTFVGKEGASGIYFIEGDEGNGFARYETASAPNWFTIAPSNGTLPAGETQNITVNLSAQGLFAGSYRGNVRIYSAHPSIEKNVPLELKVLGTPDVSLSKDSIDVGDVILGFSRGTSLVVRNRGSAELVISNVSISNADFIITETSFTVPVGESTPLHTYFYPSSTGTQSGVFTFHNNDPLKSEIQFELTGTGVYPSEVEIPTDSIRVTLLTGQKTTLELELKNNGDGATQYLDPRGLEPFVVVEGQGRPQNIGPHSSRIFNVIMDAGSKPGGVYHASIWVGDHFDPNHFYQEIPVKMTVISATDIFISEDSLDFGVRFVNEQYDSIIQLKNNGVLPLSISSIESNNAAFAISVTAPLNLNPGESINAILSFSPTTVSPQHGIITFVSNDPDENLFVLDLKGIGIDPPVLSSSDSELIVSAFVNESQSTPINLANNGGSVLKWRIIADSNPHPSAAGDFTNKAPTTSRPFLGLTEDPASGILYAHNYGSQKLYAYNPQANQWTLVGTTLYPENNFQNGGAVILNSKMYFAYAEGSTTIYIYDMILKNWTTKPNKLGFGTATITTDGTLLYLAGGGKFMSYNPRTNVWIDLPVPNFTLDGMGGLSCLNGVLYAHATSSSGFAKYTIATGIWENLIPLPGEVILGSTIDPIKKRYYAYGKNYFYEYDIAANAWSTLYFSLFEIGSSGGLAFSSKTGYEGVYILQGNTGNGFARYEPKSELAWLRSSHLVGELESMDDQTIGINCNAVNLAPGLYHGNVNIITNDPSNLTFEIPVTFNVKNPAPVIQIPSLIADTVHRSSQSITYLVIKNEGRDLLEWNLINALPSWLSVNKTTGNISGYSADSIEVTFSPGLFTLGGVADYNFEINSNDPSISQSLTRLLLTIQNHQPLLTSVIPNQILDSDQIEIPLLEHFSDADSDPLSFSVSTSENSLISTDVVDSKLIISPMKSGILSVTVTATDIYNSSIATTFEVNNLITGIDPESREPGLTASPNPFERGVTIHISEGYKFGKAAVVLFDLTGRAAWRSHEIDLTTQHELEINGNNLALGLYTCILFVNNEFIDSIRLLKN